MADKDLSAALLTAIEKFQVGVHSWNQWRLAYPNILVALVRANLKGANLRGASLKKADLRGASLVDASFSNTNFSGADLSRSRLNKTELSVADLGEIGFVGELLRTDSASVFGKVLLRAPDFIEVDSQKFDLGGFNLQGADFSGVVLIEADLSGAVLDGADFSNAVLEEADLRGTDLSGANLSEATFDGARFDKADLRGVCFRGVNLRKAWLTMADLRGVDLSRANLYEAKLIRTNLSGANLTEATLSRAYLAETNFSHATLDRADLNEADLSEADLSGATLVEANLRETMLTGTNLDNADLSEATLMNVDLSGWDLRAVQLNGADLRYADLSGANLNGVVLGKALCMETYLNGASLDKADLRQADLYRADLSEANLRGANLCDTNFERANVLGTDFTGAVLTGACIKDWNVNRATCLKGVKADFVYRDRSSGTGGRKSEFTDRYPSFGIFNPDEFSTLFQQAVETLDIVFTAGINWRVFIYAFQEIIEEYADQSIAIQALENKGKGAFIVRLEVSADADRPAIEEHIKALYEDKLFQIEEYHRNVLKAKEGEILAYKQQSVNLMTIVEKLSDRTVMTSEVTQNFLAPVANAAGTNYGSMSALQNNYGSSAEDITTLIGALRGQVQTFPADHQEESLDVISALETDIEQAQPDKKRISRWLKKLAIAGSTVGAITGGAATFSGNLTEFTSNVNALAEAIGIPLEQIQISETPEP